MCVLIEHECYTAGSGILPHGCGTLVALLDLPDGEVSLSNVLRDWTATCQALSFHPVHHTRLHMYIYMH